MLLMKVGEDNQLNIVETKEKLKKQQGDVYFKIHKKKHEENKGDEDNE